MDDLGIDARKQELLEARFLGLSKTRSGSESNMSTGSSIGVGASANSDKETDSFPGYPSTPEAERLDSRKCQKRKAGEYDSVSSRKSGGVSNPKKIHEYFEPATSPARVTHIQGDRQMASPAYSNVVRSSPSSRHSNSSNHIDFSGLVALQHKQQVPKETKCVQTELTSDKLLQLIAATNGKQLEKNKKLDELQRINRDLEFQVKETNDVATKCKSQLMQCLKVCQDLLIEKTKSEMAEARRKAMEGRLRLGQFTRQGTGYQETWSNGWGFTELGRKKERINKEKEDIEKARKILNKRKPSAVAYRGKSNSIDGEGSFAKPKEPKDALSAQDYHERDEILRQRMSAVKRDESELQFELEKLERERSLHIRELKRITNEDNSRFNNHPVLNKRYLLLFLLGKGGFSEVYKGFDLGEQRYVAVKIHHLNREWNEQKKLDYARHANREADIHRRVNHPRIVGLYDRFEVDINTFCTVLEFCGGNDLDFYLKQHRLMSEKEARTIIMQVISALVYLNSLERPVIHYDLKPGNILLCNGTVCGDIKITDFGLSKQFDEGLSSHEGMDLTSQGAGTYWYLPPECFIRGPGGQPPKIDNKVDVWSIGVIFYQCLYGQKPFGHNLTQEAILKQNTILRATEVSFPNKPSVTPEAKSFIRSCLMYHKGERASVTKLADHAYLKPAAGKRGTANCSPVSTALNM